MRWTDMSAKEMIRAWAKEETTKQLSDRYLPHPQKDGGSYWCEHDISDEIIEYDFSSIPELRGMLERNLSEEFYKDLLLPLAVAVFKEKKIISVLPSGGSTDDLEENQLQKQEKGEFTIPEFVYVF